MVGGISQTELRRYMLFMIMRYKKKPQQGKDPEYTFVDSASQQ